VLQKDGVLGEASLTALGSGEPPNVCNPMEPYSLKRYRRQCRAVIRNSLAVWVMLASLLMTGSWILPAAASFESMPCCAGKASHSADSCKTGVCSARHHHSKSIVPRILETEPLCGLRNFKTEVRARRLLRSTSALNSKSGLKHPVLDSARMVLAGALTQPCPPDCGACAAGSSGRQSQSNLAASLDRNSTPPAGCLRVGGQHASAAVKEIVSRFSSPRAPPISLS
ncbi:MAG: hypothetical protein ACXW18_08765, partial [Pyrinomonadaceae bacterium]